MSNNTFEVKPGALVTLNNEGYVIKEFDSPETIEIINLQSGLKSSVKISEITNTPLISDAPPRADLSTIDRDVWEQATYIYNTLKPILNKKNRTKEQVEKISETLLLSLATVYRYIDRIETEGTISCLIRKPRKDKFTKRLLKEVENIIKKVLVEEYLDSKQISPEVAYIKVIRLCKNSKLPIPAKQTIVRRIQEMSGVERAEKREGRNAALDLLPNKGSVPNADHLYSLWQIDHTRVDIMLVDEKYRVAIGRPWITLIIDVYSRMVVGWYISFDPPGALATGLCISRATLPKDEILAELGTPLAWPCQGKPVIIMADNAKEFRGNMLKNACDEHGIELKFRPVKKPHYGAHIERLIGTLMKRIHTLDGTTFSSIKQRENYDSEREASMTLGEFEKWLAELVLGRTHNEIHTAIGCAPIQRYKEGIMGNGNTPGIGILPVANDPQKLIYDFMPFEERTIQPMGVVLNNIHYHDPVLDKWIGAIDPKSTKDKRKFIFRYDPRDISRLLFWDPHVLQYYVIPYRDARRPAISLWELSAINRYLREQNKGEINEDLIFETYNRMCAIEEEAREKTKAARLMQERRSHHKKANVIPKSKKPAGDPEAAELPSYSNSLINFNLDNVTAFDEIEKM